MADHKFFNGATQLHDIQEIGRSRFGHPVDFVPVWTGEKWNRGPLLAVERMVRMKSNPSLHECDARCMGAKGRTMNCECSCGGKNHGRGFSDTPAF